MALTPEEVLNKTFEVTKFRDGYDMDQVDDLLDQIVVELRQRDEEIARLQGELEQANARVAELEAAPEGGTAGEQSSADDSALQAQLDEANARIAQLEAAAAAAEEAAPAQNVAEQTIVVDAQPAAPAPAAAPAGGGTDPTALKSSAMLQLALELHDKYIREGEEQRDRTLKEAEATASQLVGDAQRQRADELRRLEDERKDVSRRITELRDFESEYRNTLSSYIQSQLRELEGSPEPKGAPRGLD